MAKPVNRAQSTSIPHTDVGELFAKRFGVVRIYVVVLLMLAGAIIVSGIKTAETVQQYHQDYKTLQDMKKQQRNCKSNISVYLLSNRPLVPPRKLRAVPLLN